MGLAIGSVKWRDFVCGAMMIISPVSLCTQEPEAAILHDSGGVFLNGALAPASSAVFPNDVLQTQSQSEATLDINGTTVTIKSDTVLEFKGNELDLDHGTLLVSTARGMKVRVRSEEHTSELQSHLNLVC